MIVIEKMIDPSVDCTPTKEFMFIFETDVAIASNALVLLAMSMDLNSILESTRSFGVELNMLRRFLDVECLVFFRSLLVKGFLIF